MTIIVRKKAEQVSTRASIFATMSSMNELYAIGHLKRKV